MALINNISVYYGLAIRRTTNTSVKKMQDSIMATYYHMISTDRKPQHHLCDPGADSWCKYQRALAEAAAANRKQINYTHPTDLKKTIHPDLAKEIFPIFEDLSRAELIERCVGGYTQNANESFNSTVWKLAPKHLHSGRKIVEISSFLAGSIFNDGQHSVLKIMNEFGGLPGKNSQAYADYANKRRVKKQNKEASLASKEVRTLHKQKRTAEDEWHEETEGLIGLEVSPPKTEVVGFHPKGRPAHTSVRVAGREVRVGTRMRYLGLTLDNRWKFEAHFLELAPKLDRAALSLSRLLPNIGGPNTKVRRLYTHVIASIALYGAPVWAYEAKKSRRIRQLIRNYEEVYERVADLRKNLPSNTPIQPRSLEIIQAEAHRKLVHEWRIWLRATEHGGGAVLGALETQLREWLKADVGLTYRSTQIITGHGCFGHYLRKIGKEETSRCWHCVSNNDTASHTLRYCPAWNGEREELVRVVGQDLTWPAIIRALREKKEREAFLTFCEKVMSQKEAAERIREGIVLHDDGG
ncbi:uncharacterized protein [Mycetomoellerius zeteki]|uniref:uncharacterized protein n=1 Tax=Mycetomoellerius zeteki TaxID=64791 RepID=UPI00084E449C|nr:PREDICTED: uncharacterized protein LOC108730880 [Trachymyrmex zeteki]